MMTPEYSKLLTNNEYADLLGLTATHDITDENDKKYYYDKFCPIVYEYYNSAEDGLINKTRFFIVNHDLSDNDRIIVKIRGKNYEKGEKEYYEYLTDRMKHGQNLMIAQGSEDWFKDAALWFWQGRGTREQKGAAAVYMNAIKARKNFLLNLPSTGKIAKRISGGIRAEFSKAKVLIFSELTAQADKISKYTVHSKNSNKVNAQLIEDFNSGSVKELGSCNSLTLGLNLVGATHAVMESYIGSATKSKQKKGRLDRLASDEHADMWIIKVPGTQSEKWYKNMTKKFDLGEAVYLNSDFILRDDFDYRKSEIKTKVANTNP
jgi:superfamily II DNA or RNA helicase